MTTPGTARLVPISPQMADLVRPAALAVQHKASSSSLEAAAVVRHTGHLSPRAVLLLPGVRPTMTVVIGDRQAPSTQA